MKQADIGAKRHQQEQDDNECALCRENPEIAAFVRESMSRYDVYDVIKEKIKKRVLSAPKIKTKGFKFNRDEANER